MPFNFHDLVMHYDTVPPSAPTDIMPVERIAEFLEKMTNLAYEYGIGMIGEDAWLYKIPEHAKIHIYCRYRCDSKGRIAFT